MARFDPPGSPRYFINWCWERLKVNLYIQDSRNIFPLIYSVGGDKLPEKLYVWNGDLSLILKCVEDACRSEDFEIKQSTSSYLEFKNRGYNGSIKFMDRDVKIEVRANDGNYASAVCCCILFFLFGVGLLNLWWVVSKKPKNYIKNIVTKATTQLKTAYPGNIIEEPIPEGQI